MAKPMNARRYFRRSGVLLFVVAGIAVIGVIMAPDNLGRGFAGLFALILSAGGLWRLRAAAKISPTAIAKEHVVPGERGVRVEISEPEELP